MKDRESDTFGENGNVASCTECTGLMPSVPDTHEQDMTVSALYGIHSENKRMRRKKRK